jgi:hypothetical protein
MTSRSGDTPNAELSSLDVRAKCSAAPWSLPDYSFIALAEGKRKRPGAKARMKAEG